MRRRNEQLQIDEIIKEESNVFWWIRRDLITLTVETSDGIGLSLTPAQEDEWEEGIHERLRKVAHFLKTQSALLPPDDRIMAVIIYKKLNKFLWETKKSTSQYAEEKLEITDILTNIQNTLLLVHNKTLVLDGYNSGEESTDTVRDEAISALSKLVSTEDKDGYQQKVADVFLYVIENSDQERWTTVYSAILGLWPFLSETPILIELLFQPLGANNISYNELIAAKAAAVTLKNQALCFFTYRSQFESILRLAYQRYLKKQRVLEENLVENEHHLRAIEIIFHRIHRCLEEIEQVKIQEEIERRKKKKAEDKEIEIQHPVEIFIDKEVLIFISLLRDKKEGFIEYFLKDPRHLEMHLSYVRRCIGIITAWKGEENELEWWLADHPMRKQEMLSFLRKMEEELRHRLKLKLSCLHIPEKIEKVVNVAKCPVCGMDVDIEKAEQKVKYDGIVYYFCCSCCKTVFEKEPARYHQILRV